MSKHPVKLPSTELFYFSGDQAIGISTLNLGVLLYSQPKCNCHSHSFKSERNPSSKKAGIFEFLEFLKVVANDSTIGPYKYKKFARFQPYMVNFWSTETVALNFFKSVA